MSKVTITINTDNAAFGETPCDKAQEVSLILNKLADSIFSYDRWNTDTQILRDTNGNKVGTVIWEED